LADQIEDLENNDRVEAELARLKSKVAKPGSGKSENKQETDDV